MSTNEVAPELHELVKHLTEGGFRFELRPDGLMDDGTTKQLYYSVRILLDGLRPAQLKQLLAIVDESPYDGVMDGNGRLVLAQPR